MAPLSRRTFVTSVLAGSTLGATALGQLRRSTLPSARLLKRVGLERMWWSQAVINPKRDRVTHVTSDEHNLYVQSSAGMTTCFDAETGQKLWAAQLGRSDATSYPVTSNDEIAIVAGGPMLYAVEKFTGKSLWRIRLPAMPSARPSMDDERIYIGALNGSVYALDLRKIKELFQKSLLPEWSGETVAWRYQTGEEVTTSPVSTGRVVNFASIDKSLYSVQVDTRKLLWQFETNAPISAPLAYTGRLLFLASKDFNFYCLDAENGSVQWEFVSGLPVTTAPKVIGPQVYLSPTRGGLYALDVNSGRNLWWDSKVTRFIAASADTIYASDRVGNVVLLDRSDGSRAGAVPMRNFTHRYANGRSDRIYMTTGGGLVMALREIGQEFPIFHKFPERRPLIPEFAPDGDPAAPGEEPPAPGVLN